MKNIIITLLVVLVVLGVIIFAVSYFKLGVPVSQQNSATPTSSQESGQVTSLPTDKNDVSDAALKTDAAAVDVQMKNIDADVQNVGAAVADAPIFQ